MHEWKKKKHFYICKKISPKLYRYIGVVGVNYQLLTGLPQQPTNATVTKALPGAAKESLFSPYSPSPSPRLDWTGLPIIFKKEGNTPDCRKDFLLAQRPACPITRSCALPCLLTKMQVTYIGTLWREGFVLVLFFVPYTTESILGSPEARTRVGEWLLGRRYL